MGLARQPYVIRHNPTIGALLLAFHVASFGAAGTAWAAPKATVIATDDVKARELAVSAKVAFDEGRFAEAAELLERAYALSPSSSLLYNLGRAHQQAGNKRRAIDAYRKYLAAETSPPDEGLVRRSIKQLEDELDQEAALAAKLAAEKQRADVAAAEGETAQAAQVEAEERARHKVSAWPWIVTGVGVSGLAVAAIFGSLANKAHGNAVAEPDVDSAQSKQASARHLSLVANVALIGGGALTVTGIVWGIFDLRAASASPVTVGIGPGSLMVAGSF